MKKKTDFMDLYLSGEKKKKAAEKKSSAYTSVPVQSFLLGLVFGTVRIAALILLTVLAANGTVALILDVTRGPLLAYYGEILELIKNIF